MIPAAFDYVAPTSVAEALAALAEAGDDAKVLAGGQSLIPLLSMRLAAPGMLVDINAITELAYVRNRQSRLAFSVDLMKALGGGWSPKAFE